jgi:hypothetical protein
MQDYRRSIEYLHVEYLFQKMLLRGSQLVVRNHGVEPQ